MGVDVSPDPAADVVHDPVPESLAAPRIADRDRILDPERHRTREAPEAAGRTAGPRLEHRHAFEAGPDPMAVFRRAR